MFKLDQKRQAARRTYRPYLDVCHEVAMSIPTTLSKKQVKLLKLREKDAYTKELRKLKGLKKAWVCTRADIKYLQAEHISMKKYLRKNLAKQECVRRARVQRGIVTPQM